MKADPEFQNGPFPIKKKKNPGVSEEKLIFVPLGYELHPESKLPNGLTLTEGGYIVGKPSETVTDHSFTVVASAYMAESVEATYTITVGLVFDSAISLQHGVEGQEYFGVVSATGAGGIKYSLKEGSKLPEGLELSKDGEITGVPTTAGVYKFTVVASAKNKLSDEMEFTLYIANAPKNENFLQKLFSGLPTTVPSGKKETV